MLAAILLVGMSLGSEQFNDALRRSSIPDQQSTADDDLVALGPPVANGAAVAAPPPPDGRIDKEMWARVVPLVERLVGEDLADRERAKGALLLIGPPAVEALLVIAKKSPFPQQEQIADILPRFGPTAIRKLASVGSRDNVGYGSPATMWRMAQEATARMGADALPTLEGMFEHGVSGAGSFALGVLRQMPPDLSLPVLLRLAKHPNPETRKWVISVVGQIDRPEASQARRVVGEALVDDPTSSF